MAPVIRVSDELYGKLANLAEGFDIPSNVIERLLKKNAKSQSSNSVPQLPQQKVESQSPNRSRGITKEIAMLTCRLGDRIYEGHMRTPDARKKLEEIGMNRGSAAMYLGAYAAMLTGRVFRRGMKTADSRRMFGHIKKKYGKVGFRKAIEAYDQHLVVLEEDGYTTKTKRAFLADMRTELSML